MAWERGGRESGKGGNSWGRQRTTRSWEGAGQSSRSPSPGGVRRRPRPFPGKGGKRGGRSRSPRGRPPSPKRLRSCSRDGGNRGRRDRPPPLPRPGRGEAGVTRAPLPRRRKNRSNSPHNTTAGEHRRSREADRNRTGRSFNDDNVDERRRRSRSTGNEKSSRSLEEGILAVELLKTWDDKKSVTADDMEQAISKFLSEDAKRFRITPRLSTEIFLRGTLRTLWDIDRLLREMNPKEDLQRYTKSPLVLSTLRVCAYRLMWTPNATVRMVVQGASDLMRKVGLSNKTEQDFISNAVARMMKAFEKGHQEWDRKKTEREEMKRKEKEASRPNKAKIGAAVGQVKPRPGEGRKLPPAAKRPKMSGPGLISVRADMEEEAGMEDGEAEEIAKSTSAVDGSQASKSAVPKDDDTSIEKKPGADDIAGDSPNDDSDKKKEEAGSEGRTAAKEKDDDEDSESKPKEGAVEIADDAEEAADDDKEEPEVIADDDEDEDDDDDEDDLEEEDEEEVTVIEGVAEGGPQVDEAEVAAEVAAAVEANSEEEEEEEEEDQDEEDQPADEDPQVDSQVEAPAGSDDSAVEAPVVEPTNEVAPDADEVVAEPDDEVEDAIDEADEAAEDLNKDKLAKALAEIGSEEEDGSGSDHCDVEEKDGTVDVAADAELEEALPETAVAESDAGDEAKSDLPKNDSDASKTKADPIAEDLLADDSSDDKQEQEKENPDESGIISV